MAEPWTQVWLDHEQTGPPDPSRFRPVQNLLTFRRVKPVRLTGFWTSPLRADGACGWIEYLTYEDWWPHGRTDPPAYLLEPASDLRVLTIDSYADLEEAVAAFPSEEPDRDDGFGDRGIDFEAAAGAGYDAVYLTDAGQWAPRLTVPLSLYGWDCESVLWLRWRFTDTRPYERSVAELARLVLEGDQEEAASG